MFNRELARDTAAMLLILNQTVQQPLPYIPKDAPDTG
jgi:hypothetical protein